MLGPFQVRFSSHATLPFNCARYCGPVLAGLDKSSIKFYAIEESSLILPVAFSFESGEASVEFPLWCRLVLKDLKECKLRPITSGLGTADSIALKWFSGLGAPFRGQFAWEEVLPEVLTPQRPLCNGCLLPVSLAGKQFLLQVSSEQEGFFNFDLSDGELRFIDDDLRVLEVSESLKKELELVKLQMSMTSESSIFLLTGVTFIEQEAVLQCLGVTRHIDLLTLIPEEPFEGAEDLETENSLYFGLGGVEILGESLLEAILKKHRGSNLVLISGAGNGNLTLDRLAARFNFTLWTHEIKSLQPFGHWKEMTAQLLMKSGWTQERAQAHLKQTLTPTTFKTLTLPRTEFYGYSQLREQFLKYFLDPLLKRDAYEALGLPLTPPGLLLHGPSGIGKTALLHSVLTSPKISAHYTVLHVPGGASLLSRYLGGTEANLRALFTQARANRPCIIFIDQITSLGRKRSLVEPDNGGRGGKQRYLSTLLNEMDGIGGSEGVTVVATCLDLKELDEALLRPGRLERHVLMPFPSPEDVKELAAGYGVVAETKWKEGMTCSEIICQLKRPK